eukprot:gene21160-27415_t
MRIFYAGTEGDGDVLYKINKVLTMASWVCRYSKAAEKEDTPSLSDKRMSRNHLWMQGCHCAGDKPYNTQHLALRHRDLGGLAIQPRGQALEAASVDRAVHPREQSASVYRPGYT